MYDNHVEGVRVRETGWNLAAWRTFLISCLLTLVSTACMPPQLKANSTAPPSGELGIVLRRGTLVIATDPDFPPQSQYHPNTARAPNTLCGPAQYTADEFSGFDIDVAIEIAHRLGVEPCFVSPAWSQLISGSWSDLWDVSVGSMVITTDRMEKLYFTQPYTSGAAVFFVHKDNQTYHSPADLNGKRIGVCTGCAYEEYLKGNLEIPGEKIEYQVKDAIAVGYNTDTSALIALGVGDGVQVDAVLTDPDTGKKAIQDGLPIRQIEGVLYQDFVAVALDKKSSSDPISLAQRITKIILDMHQDGTLVKLSEQYYNGDFTKPAAKFDLPALGQYDLE